MEEKETNVGEVVEERVFTQKEVEAIIASVNQQARSQVESYAKRCQMLEEHLSYKRLDYLFKVVDNLSNFSTDFVAECIDEIENSLTIPKTKTEENK